MKVPTHDVDAERAVLSCAFLDNSTLDVAACDLEPADFYLASHALMFESMLTLAAAGAPIDHITLRGEMAARKTLERAGGDEALLRLTDAFPAVSHIDAYVRTVRERAQIRRLLDAAQEIAARASSASGTPDELLDWAEHRVWQVADRRTEQHAVMVGDVVKRRFAELQKASAGGAPTMGVPSGFEALDRMTAGWRGGQLILIAGRPGMGKTALLGNLAAMPCTRALPVSVFSLEMQRDELVDRWLTAEGRVDGSRVRNLKLTSGDWSALAQAAEFISTWPLRIDDTAALSLIQLRGKLRRDVARRGVRIAFVDYLQLMRAGVRMESREQEIGAISRGLKQIAKELDIPIVVLATLNRDCEKRQDKRPQLSDLRESGSLEYDADTIIFIYRDDAYNRESDDAGIAELIVAKQRGGPTGTVRVRWFAQHRSFYGLADDDPANDPPESDLYSRVHSEAAQ